MPRRVTRRLCAQRRVYGARLNRALLKLSAVLRARILPGRLFHSGIVDTRVEFKRGDLLAFRGSSLYDVMVPSFSITDAALVSRLDNEIPKSSNDKLISSDLSLNRRINLRLRLRSARGGHSNSLSSLVTTPGFLS